MTVLLPAMMAGSAVADYFVRRNAAKQAGEYGRQYAQSFKDLANRGIEVDKRMGGISSNINNQANTARSQYLGELSSRGMLGSIAGQRGANEFSESAMGAIGNARTSLELQDEQVKRDAMERYNQAIYNSQMAQSQGMAGATTALTGGLTNAASMRAGMLSDEEYLNLYKRELSIMENNTL